MGSRKIYLGPANTSNFFKELEISLKTAGLFAEFIPWSNEQHSFYEKNSQTFKLFNRPNFTIFGKNVFAIINSFILKPFYTAFCIFKYKIFFFIKPTTFSRNNRDLFWLKFFRKKVFFFYIGCNDRNLLYSKSEYYICNLCADSEMKNKNNCYDLKKKKEYAQYFEKYATKVFGFNDNIDLLKGKGFRLALGLEPIKIPYKEKDYTKKLTILHLPSNPLHKGTNIIEPILKRIEKERDVNIIIKNEIWPHSKLQLSLNEGHILIDSLAEYTFGKLSLEAIQYACLPLNAYPEWIADYYSEPPVVAVTADTLYSTLINLIDNRKLLESYINRSQRVYNNYFTYEAAGNYYKELLN